MSTGEIVLPAPQEALRLTRAELRVASLFAEGHTWRETAKKLAISKAQVNKTVDRVMRKLKMQSRNRVILSRWWYAGAKHLVESTGFQGRRGRPRIGNAE